MPRRRHSSPYDRAIRHCGFQLFENDFPYVAMKISRGSRKATVWRGYRSRAGRAHSPARLPKYRSAEGKLSDKSHLDRIREKRVTPLVQRPHEVRLGVDGSTLAIAPFSSVGIERKVSHVVFAGLFPMVDRQRLAIVLAIETGRHAFYAARLSPMVLREDHLRSVAPQHQNVPPFRAEETTKAQQFAIGLIGRMIARGHIGVEQSNPHAVVIAGMRCFHESA